MLPDKPLSIGGVIDAGLTFFRATFKATFSVAAIAAIPYAVASAFMNAQGSTIAADADPALVLAAAMDSLKLMPLVYLSLLFTMACIIHRQAALARDEAPNLNADLISGFKYMIPLTLLALLFVFIVSVGFILLIIPGVLLMVSTSLFLYPRFVEGRSVWSGVHRSHQLVWPGNWWRTATVVTMISIIGIVLFFAFYIVLGAMVFIESSEGPSATAIALQTLLSWAMMALYVPLSSAMFLTLYNDLRLRKEGDDIETRLGELDRPSAT